MAYHGKAQHNKGERKRLKGVHGRVRKEEKLFIQSTEKLSILGFSDRVKLSHIKWSAMGEAEKWTGRWRGSTYVRWYKEDDNRDSFWEEIGTGERKERKKLNMSAICKWMMFYEYMIESIHVSSNSYIPISFSPLPKSFKLWPWWERQPNGRLCESERESERGFEFNKIGVSMQVIHSFDSLHAIHIQT